MPPEADTTPITETKPITPPPPPTEGNGGEVKPTNGQTTEFNWPSDWHDKMASGDDKLLSEVKRYASPKELAKALVASKQKIREGVQPKQLSDNPTEAELKEYREALGIPEKPDGYKLELSDGRTLGDADKPLVDEFLKSMHGKHIPPKMVNEAVNAFFDMRDKEIEQLQTKQAEQRQRTEDDLRAEYGENYRRNLNQVTAMLEQFGSKEIADKLIGATLADGSVIGNDPDVVRFLVKLAHELNPTATVVPNDSPGALSAIEDEIGKIENMMRDNPPGSKDAYFRDEAKQKRYRDLITAREKSKQRK